MGYFSRDQLAELGLGSYGEDVLVSDRCSIYGTANVHLGSHIRIDDFAVITAQEPVIIGSHVHISVRAFISGANGVNIGDFSTISIGSTILTSSDDFSGAFLTGPTVPDHLRNPTNAQVIIGRHVVVGAHSVVMPGVTIPEGAIVGALSFVPRSLESWSIYAGIPVRFLKKRAKDLLELEKQLLV